MIRRSIRRTAISVRARTIPITSKRCHSSMRPGFDGRARVPQCNGTRLCSNGAVRLAFWIFFVGGFAALNLYSRAVGPKPADDVIYQYDFAIGSLAGYAVLFSLVLALTIGLPRREVLALRPPASWAKALGLALGALIVDLHRGGDRTLALQRGRRAEPDPGRVGQQPCGRLRAQLRRRRLRRPDHGGAPLPRRRALAAARAHDGAGFGGGDRALLRARPRPRALAGGVHLVRHRRRARPAPDGQHLPGDRRPLHASTRSA